MKAVLRLDAFIGDARPHDLRKPVDIDRVHVERLFNLAAHGVGPRLGAKDADLQRGLARVEALFGVFVEDRQAVRWGDSDPLGPEILNQPHLALGHAAGDWRAGEAEIIGPQMYAEAAGEEAIAIGVMQHVAGAEAGGAKGPRDDLTPHIQIALGVTDDGGLTRGAGGGVNARHLLPRHGEHAERVIVPEVLLHRERELREIRQRGQIIGVNARRIEARLVMGNVVIGVAQRPFQAVKLKRGDLIAAGDLDRVEIGFRGRQVFHQSSPECCGELCNENSGRLRVFVT